MNAYCRCLFTLLHLVQLVARCAGSCYFPAELQGEYAMQVGGSGQLQRVQVTAEAVPVWGLCHSRHSHHHRTDSVVLNDSFNGTACFRCFQLRLRSANVLQVRACATCLDQCFLSEQAARHSCLPPPDTHPQPPYKEITLFRTKELGGGDIKKLFCPITGHYSVTSDCGVGRLDNCATGERGPRLDVGVRGCPQQEFNMECLGDWPGPDGQRFLALLDTSEPRPRYRCALYRKYDEQGNVSMAFSSDSTCESNLYNASSGHMTWKLTPDPSPPWPANHCSFPQWSQGKWEHLDIDYNLLVYKDVTSFHIYHMQCAQQVETDRFIVYSLNSCGEEIYKCLKLKHRSGNVLEFQIGSDTSTYPNTLLCSDQKFTDNVWVTQARLEGLQVSPCPVTGDYSGVIPDAPAPLCARLASDRSHQEIMYFTVYDCDQHDVYEEREYQCLGQWEEGGVTYTYTQRKDFGSYECFVGSILSNGEIYIKEAGQHCGRGIDPLRLGMKLQAKAVGVVSKPVEPSRPPPVPVTSTPRLLTPTRPWKPITGPPPKMSGQGRASAMALVVSSALTLLFTRAYFSATSYYLLS